MGWLADFVDSIGAMLLDELAGDVRMFPDGNASVARLLVQKMIPECRARYERFRGCCDRSL